MSKEKQLAIGMLVHPAGQHPAAWLDPRAVLGGEVSLAHYSWIAQTAERGLFDFFFLADSPSVRSGNPEVWKRFPTYMGQFEPITLLSALAAVTDRIGLAVTGSTTYFEPYNMARQIASLDHLSAGRAGWNVVTSSSKIAGANFGRTELEEHSVRYRRAREFLDVVRGLWDSWDDDAFVRDVQAVEYFKPEKLHRLDHKGEFYAVAGPLNIQRPPQGHPVILQAGGSEAGREFAAETADVIFTIDRTFNSAKAFYDDVKGRLSRYGRDADDLKIVVSLSTVIGRTEDEAREKFDRLQAAIHPDVGRELVSNDLDVDLSGVPLDSPIPRSLLPDDTNRGKTYLKSIKDLITDGEPTLRQVYTHYAAARGGMVFVGTAPGVADLMEEWLKGGAADGFMLSLATLPTELEAFVDLVIPELQRRGLFRSRYEGRTLREHLGLKRPPSRYAKV